ncbi:uncharacterized protein TNCV_3499341 [Trichonephila clavipes]|nr:uncharacterized protein TNCV_3499341 [Trichonephila clavipes]
MDEILTTARDLELEVNENDIEELTMGHEDELTIEELQEILNEEHQETQRNVSPSEQEEDERGPMPTSAIKDLLKKWEAVRAMVLECTQNKLMSIRKDLIDELKIFGMSSRHHIDDFMRGRIIGKIEEGQKITDVAREFDIAHSVVSRLWKSFKTTGMCSRRHGGARVRSTTPAEDRYIVLSAKRNRRTTAQQVANQFLLPQESRSPEKLLPDV